MSFLYDFFPILLFFTFYKIYDIFVATAIAIIATLIQVILTRIKTKKYNKTHLISLITISILGGATIFFKNEMFIKWKTTAVYWLLSLVFLFSKVVSKKHLLEHFASKSMELPNKIWAKLNFSWVLFFLIMGFINLYIVYNYDTNTWVNFKLFGTLGLTFAFIIIQVLYMAKFVKDKQN